MEVVETKSKDSYVRSDFESAVEKVDSIQTMPVVAQRLTQLTADPEFNMDTLYGLVKSDPVIAAKVLKIASSPAYGTRPASNLRSALIRIGMRDLRKLVMAAAIIGGKPSKFTTVLWSYSLKVASISESIAQLVRTKDLDDPFLCGLLHDFGTVIMNQVIGKPYRAALGEPCQGTQSKIEQENFGYDHCDLGVMVAQQWKLFDALEHVMQHHHEPLVAEELGLEEASQVGVFVVALARHATTDLSELEGEAAEETNALCERLSLTLEELSECQASGIRRFNEMYAGLLSGR